MQRLLTNRLTFNRQMPTWAVPKVFSSNGQKFSLCNNMRINCRPIKNTITQSGIMTIQILQ